MFTAIRRLSVFGKISTEIPNPILNFPVQTIGDVERRAADATRLRAAVPRAGRVHKRVAVVRRDLPLSIGLRRGSDPLLGPPATAASAPGHRHPRDRHDHRRDLLRDLADLQATGEPIDIAAPAEEHLLGDGDHRREGSDLLTQRQFCAIRRGRPGDHRVTIAHGRPIRRSSWRRRVPFRVLLKGSPVPAPRRRPPPRNAQNCSATGILRRRPRLCSKRTVRCSMTCTGLRFLSPTRIGSRCLRASFGIFGSVRIDWNSQLRRQTRRLRDRCLQMF